MADNQTSNESTELDSLLNEYKQPQTQPDPEITELVGFVREQKQTQETKVVTDAIADAVSSIKQDDALKDVSDNDIQDFLEGEGRRDSTINEAFMNRAKNPTEWDQARDKVRTRFVEKATPKDTTADDVAAAKASVRGMTSTVPEETGTYRNSAKEVADMQAMSDVALRDYKLKVIAEQNSG